MTTSENRIQTNLKQGDSDYIGWVNELIDSISFSSVLDIGCGTGEILSLYTKKKNITDIFGVDSDEKNIGRAKENLPSNVRLIRTKMETMFNLPEIMYRGEGYKRYFDLISCFYSLYYSENVKRTIAEIMRHVASNGVFLVVGSYGDTNKNFFDLIEKHHPLSSFVKESCSTFMQNILQILGMYGIVTEKTFENHIKFSDMESILKYYQNTLFYNKNTEEGIKEELYHYFEDNKNYVLTKQVKAYIVNKK
jgi:SAM-dependent methyltransferase